MQPSTRPRLVLATFACVTALAVFGCNTLLDNRPADINGDLFATEPADNPDAAPGAERDHDASVPDPSDPVLGGDRGSDVGDDAAAPTTSGPDAAVGAADAAMPRACAPGRADCNHVASDGCEADLTSATSCGACGVKCADASHAAPACVGGACSISCDPGFDDCNHVAADGCEAQLLKDKHNCGACGQICIVGTCQAGACVWKP